MPSPEALQVAREWAEKAENDLRNAAYTVGMAKGCPTDTVCFHAQQCVEKYLKAVLTVMEIDFPRTHRIDELLGLIPPAARPDLSSEDQDLLTEYATVTRYPGDYDPILLAEARGAVRIARRMRRRVRAALPRSVLRRS
jgi:HEPN domain-containing protein